MSKRSLDMVMPELLKKRIKEHKIPPAPGQAMFDEILVYQIPDEEKASETFGKGSSIIKPQTRKSADEQRCPRGVIVSAGLTAMDYLHDHGMQIGEMIRYSPHVYTRFELDHDEMGRERYMPFMKCSDIKVSEDVPERLVSGELELVYEDGQHRYHKAKRRDPATFDDSI